MLADEELKKLLRRDWAVRVLDAWAHDVSRSKYWFTDKTEPSNRYACYCRGRNPREECFMGPTPDAARHAAALAVFPVLPAETQTKLGPCP